MADSSTWKTTHAHDRRKIMRHCNIELGAWLISCLTVWAYYNERKGIALGFLKQHPNFMQILGRFEGI
jgi:hypothetical protein